MYNPLVYIILVNFNGSKDTIECLDSINNITYPNFKTLIVDNASVDDSIDKIQEWIKGHRIKVDLIINKDNKGFAGGNNTAIKVAQEENADLILLLNNDTVVEPDFLSHLVKFMNENPDYYSVCPQIRYYNPQNRIWNCGGKINSFGLRKYFYSDQSVEKVSENKKIEVTYITGCAMLFRYKELGLLTERFFFGEEDIEMSLRIKDLGKKMACITDSVIYHKVSRSVSNNFNNSKMPFIYIHYLNRFIHFRMRWNNILKWRMWQLMYFIYITFLLWIRHKISFKIVLKLLTLLFNNSRKLDAVDYHTFKDAFILFA